jgi:hypothetical protein
MDASMARVEQSRANRPSSSILNFGMTSQISDDAVAQYRAEVTEYLKSYETHLRDKRVFDAVRARSREVTFAFTNDRAGVPAEGVRAIIHVPDEVRVIKRSEFPEDPGMPGRPKPPRAHSILDTIPAVNRGLDLPFMPAMRAMPTMGRPRNVSPPTIRSGGSTEIEFTVGEILHNLQEDSNENPLVFVFPRAATWTIPYEMHARNLPSPKRGELTIRTTVKAPAVVTAKDA